MGGGWGEAGVGGKPKVGKAIIQHELIQSTGWAKIAVRSSTVAIGTPCSPINAPQGQEIYPHCLTALAKSRQ